MNAAVKQSRACDTCGYTSPHLEERVVGACVPGYHDLALVAAPYTDVSRFFTEANRGINQWNAALEAWLEEK